MDTDVSGLSQVMIPRVSIPYQSNQCDFSKSVWRCPFHGANARYKHEELPFMFIMIFHFSNPELPICEFHRPAWSTQPKHGWFVGASPRARGRIVWRLRLCRLSGRKGTRPLLRLCSLKSTLMRTGLVWMYCLACACNQFTLPSTWQSSTPNHQPLAGRFRWQIDRVGFQETEDQDDYWWGMV